MNRAVSVFLAAMVFGVSAHAQFEGNVILEPKGCELQGKCTLKEKLRFKDKFGVDWEAAAGLKTDGASIPPFFKPFVGQSFDKAFIKSAIIHDHYCDRHVRPWRQTHRVFYDGLIDQGVPEGKAKLMYFAVYLGGPKWVELIPGNTCKGNCINKITNAAGAPVINFREVDYSLFDMNAILGALGQELDKDPAKYSLEQLEKMAQQQRPNDYYYRNGSQIEVNGLPEY